MTSRWIAFTIGALLIGINLISLKTKKYYLTRSAPSIKASEHPITFWSVTSLTILLGLIFLIGSIFQSP